jgi:hypothetical protein
MVTSANARRGDPNDNTPASDSQIDPVQTVKQEELSEEA